MTILDESLKQVKKLLSDITNETKILESKVSRQETLQELLSNSKLKLYKLNFDGGDLFQEWYVISDSGENAKIQTRSFFRGEKDKKMWKIEELMSGEQIIKLLATKVVMTQDEDDD